MASTPAIPPARASRSSARASATTSRSATAGSISVAVATDSIEAGRRLQHAALRRVLHEGGPRIVYQPQLSLSRLVVDGYEALARFPDTPIRGTEQWFARARELGMGPALEISALQNALAHRDERPAGTTLAINLSPSVLTSAAVAGVLPEDLSGIEIELTEHEWAPGSGRLRRQLDALRERGAKIAIDDVGVAHSGLRRVIDLAPDRLKLDRHLVLGICTSTAKSALIRAVVDLAEHIGAGVVAEGVESIDDLEALSELDVGYVQGWVVGLPEPGFEQAEPLAVAAGRDSLTSMLVGPRARGTLPLGGTIDGMPPPVLTHDSTADVEELLVGLTTVTSLAGLANLVGTCAGVLGGDALLVSVLREDSNGDGATIQAVRGRATAAPARRLRMADYPLTRDCLESRMVVPIYLGTVGDSAQWQMLTGLGYRAALLVPVISRDRVLGLLECYRLDTAPWTRRQIRSARTVAAMLGPVLDLHTAG